MAKIAVAGKGGVGKTTVVSLIIRGLVEKKKTPILAVDADPNSNLYLSLGLNFHNQTIADLREDVRSQVPSGFSRSDYFRLKLEEIIIENKDFDLLVMGRPEGPGCYCSVNNLLREYLSRLSQNYPYVIIDCEAGLEHLSRRTTDDMDTLILVTEAYFSSLIAVKNALEIASKLPLRIKNKYIIINKVKSIDKRLKDELDKLKVPILAKIPYEKRFVLASQNQENLLSIDIPKNIKKIIEQILEKIG
jgi:CO dehydrogenase maturation factor